MLEQVLQQMSNASYLLALKPEELALDCQEDTDNYLGKPLEYQLFLDPGHEEFTQH